MNRFEELEAYVAVVDHRGFSHAADKLGIAKSMVSRRVSELERRLGVQLLQRTTRRQSVTDAGREFYQRASQLISDMRDAEQSVAHGQTAISGRIRLALPLGIGVSQLAQPISEFLDRHPDIRIEVDLNDRRQDLIEENIDLPVFTIDSIEFPRRGNIVDHVAVIFTDRFSGDIRMMSQRAACPTQHSDGGDDPDQESMIGRVCVHRVFPLLSVDFP